MKQLSQNQLSRQFRFVESILGLCSLQIVLQLHSDQECEESDLLIVLSFQLSFPRPAGHKTSKDSNIL